MDQALGTLVDQQQFIFVDSEGKKWFGVDLHWHRTITTSKTHIKVDSFQKSKSVLCGTFGYAGVYIRSFNQGKSILKNSVISFPFDIPS